MHITAKPSLELVVHDENGVAENGDNLAVGNGDTWTRDCFNSTRRRRRESEKLAAAGGAIEE